MEGYLSWSEDVGLHQTNKCGNHGVLCGWFLTFSVRKPCLCGWPAGSGKRGTGCWLEVAPSDPPSGIWFPSLLLQAMQERRGKMMKWDDMRKIKDWKLRGLKQFHLPESQTYDRLQWTHPLAQHCEIEKETHSVCFFLFLHRAWCLLKVC